MSFFGKHTLNSYNELFDTYMDYSFIALAGSATTVYKDFGRQEYTRTRAMLRKEILDELDKSYSSPEQAVTYRRNRRFMFI